MKKLFFLPLVFLFSVAVTAQKYDSWKVFHNRKEEASFNLKKETDDERRVVLLNRNIDLPGFFVIEYTPAKDQADWIRSMAFYDSSDRLLRQFDNTLFLRVINSEMTSIMDGKQKVRVYSWAVPKDPALAATVRARRVLLCTLYTL